MVAVLLLYGGRPQRVRAEASGRDEAGYPGGYLGSGGPQRMLVVEKAEQEMFGADPVAFEIAGLLYRPFERSRGFGTKRDLGSRPGGGADAGQRALQVFRHGGPLEAETMEHRERHPLTLPHHRDDEMFRAHGAMTASVCFFVRLSDESSRCLRETVEHALLDHLVRPQQERLRDRQAERPGSLHVDRQLERGRLLDREVSRLSPSENLVQVRRASSVQVRVIRSVGYEPAGIDKFSGSRQILWLRTSREADVSRQVQRAVFGEM